MPRPTTKTDLLRQSQANFEQLLELIDSMPDEMQLALFDYNERDKTLRDILTHLYEWQMLLLHFVQTNLAKTSDFVSFLPAPYNFKTYPKMNQELWQKHQKYTFERGKIDVAQKSYCLYGDDATASRERTFYQKTLPMVWQHKSWKLLRECNFKPLRLGNQATKESFKGKEMTQSSAKFIF